MADIVMVANPKSSEEKQEGTPSNPDTLLGVDAYTVPQGIDAADTENVVIDAQEKINQERDTLVRMLVELQEKLARIDAVEAKNLNGEKLAKPEASSAYDNSLKSSSACDNSLKVLKYAALNK